MVSNVDASPIDPIPMTMSPLVDARTLHRVERAALTAGVAAVVVGAGTGTRLARQATPSATPLLLLAAYRPIGALAAREG